MYKTLDGQWPLVKALGWCIYDESPKIMKSVWPLHFNGHISELRGFKVPEGFLTDFLYWIPNKICQLQVACDIVNVEPQTLENESVCNKLFFLDE